MNEKKGILEALEFLIWEFHWTDYNAINQDRKWKTEDELGKRKQ